MTSYLDLGLYRNIFVFKSDYRELLKNMQDVQFDNSGNFLTRFIVPDYLPLKGDQFILYPEISYKTILDTIIEATDNFKYFSIPVDQVVVGFVNTGTANYNDILLGAFKR